MRRRPYIDWTRGIAVLVMIEWHALDSWTLVSAREGTFFWVLAFIGGWAAPLFLFLAGVAVPLAGEARMSRGESRHDASRALQRRGWQVFVIAHLFRLQSFLLNPVALWSSIIKPDILNILGLGLVAAAFVWGRATSRRGVWLLLAMPALSAALLAPLARTWSWPALLYPRFEAYIRPVGNLGVFTLFPWIGFLLAGAVIGVWIAHERDTPDFHRRLSFAGTGLMIAGGVGSYLPAPLAPSAFWTTSLSFFLIRCGAMTVLLSLAWLWTRGREARRSPVIVLGRSSLFVYWVHVELAYGFFSKPWHKNLPLTQSLVGFVLLSAFMVLLAIGWQRWRKGPLIPPHLTLAPERAH